MCKKRIVEHSGHQQGLRLGEDLEVGDDVGAILGIGNTRERHLAARYDGLGVLEIAAKLVLAPHEAALPKLADIVGVGVAIRTTSLAAQDIVERGANGVLGGIADEMTGAALLEHVGAVVRTWALG